MAIEIIVPRLGWTMEEGIFQGWLKNDGDPVREGEPLFSLESDKATQEIEASGSGVLRISPKAPEPGATVSVGALLGYLLAEGESVSFDSGSGTPSRKSSAVPASAPRPEPSESLPARPNSAPVLGAITVSPRAARTASALGVDLNQLRGTGRTGRIRERDVLAAAAQADRKDRPVASNPVDLRASDLSGRVLPISPTRRTIARRMSAGFHEAAPVTLTTRVDATDLVHTREQLKEAAGLGQSAPSFNDLLVKFTAAALQQHPLLQTQWRDETLFVPTPINIALAVETAAGLLTPVIRDVPALTVHQVAAVSRTLIEDARAGRLLVGHLHGGTFTLTSLGSLGIDHFNPIINLPQSAILGVGRIVREPVFLGDQITPRDILTLSLTFDHRVIDGAPAARFLETLRQIIARPAQFLNSGTCQ